MKSIIGTGTAGTGDGNFLECELYEPEGLVFGEGKLYIADPNNHLIRVADFATKQVTTLKVTG